MTVKDVRDVLGARVLAGEEFLDRVVVFEHAVRDDGDDCDRDEDAEHWFRAPCRLVPSQKALPGCD